MDRIQHKKYNLLFIDDDSDYVFLIKESLDPFFNKIHWIDNAPEALNFISRFLEFDAVLVDYQLKDNFGTKIIAQAQEQFPHLPIILLTSLEEKWVEKDGLKGVWEYLEKSDITPILLERTIRYAIQKSESLKALSQIEKKHTALIQNSLDLIQIVQLSGEILYESPAVFNLLGYHSQERIHMPFLNTIHPTDHNKIEEFFKSAILSSTPLSSIEYRGQKKDGSWVCLETTLTNALNNPFINGFVLNSRDITERKLLDEKIGLYHLNIENNLKEKEKSLQKAQKIQQKLNTLALPHIIDVPLLACYMPSAELGGDYFNVIQQEDRLLIIIADCTGHGIDASMDSVLVKSVADRYLHLLAGDMPDFFLKAINADMMTYLLGESFFTMFAGVLNLEDKTFVYANGNSELPYVYRKGEVISLPNTAGFHIGFQEDSFFEKKEFVLEEGDVLFIVSDALREIFLKENKIVGHQGVRDLVKNFKPSLLKTFHTTVDEIKKLNNETLPLRDDLTMLFLSFLSPFHKTYTTYTQEEIIEAEEEITLELEKRYFSDKEIQRIIVSYEEMTTNAISHGNCFDPTKKVVIDAKIDGLYASFVIKDEGKGFCPTDVPDPTDIQQLLKWMDQGETEKYTHGRGIFLTKKYMNQVSYNEKGNEVTIFFHREKKETFFLYYEQEKVLPPPSQRTRFFWHKAFEEREILLSTQRVFDIVFPLEESLSSEDLRKIFILYQHALKTKKHLKMYFEEESAMQILKELHLEHDNILDLKLFQNPL